MNMKHFTVKMKLHTIHMHAKLGVRIQLHCRLAFPLKKNCIPLKKIGFRWNIVAKFFVNFFVTNFHSVKNKSKVGIYKGIRTMFQKHFWCKMLPVKYREVSSVEVMKKTWNVSFRRDENDDQVVDSRTTKSRDKRLDFSSSQHFTFCHCLTWTLDLKCDTGNLFSQIHDSVLLQLT